MKNKDNLFWKLLVADFLAALIIGGIVRLVSPDNKWL